MTIMPTIGLIAGFGAGFSKERVFGLPRRSSSEVCQSELSSLTSIIGGER